MDILDKREREPRVEFSDLRVGDVFERVGGMLFMKVAASSQGNAIELKKGVCHSEIEESELVIPLDAKLVLNDYQQGD